MLQDIDKPQFADIKLHTTRGKKFFSTFFKNAAQIGRGGFGDVLYYGHRSGEELRRSTLDGRGTVRIGPGGYRVCWRIASRGKPPEGTGEIFLPAQENAPARFKDGQREDNSIHGFRSLARSRSPEGSAGSRLTEKIFFRRFFRGADQRRAAIRRRAATAAIVTRDVTNTRAGNGRSLNKRSPTRGSADAIMDRPGKGRRRSRCNVPPSYPSRKKARSQHSYQLHTRPNKTMTGKKTPGQQKNRRRRF